MEYDTGIAIGSDTATSSNEDPELPFGNCFDDHYNYMEDELKEPYTEA